MTDRCTDCHEPIEGEPLRLGRGLVCEPCFERWAGKGETVPTVICMLCGNPIEDEEPQDAFMGRGEAHAECLRDWGEHAVENLSKLPICKGETMRSNSEANAAAIHNDDRNQLPEFLADGERPPALVRSSYAGRTTRAEDVRPADRDIAALIRTSEILQSLSADEQRRVLAWLRDRYAKETP